MTGASRWRLVVAPGAARALESLPEGVAAAITEFMVGALMDSPRRVGKPLENELAGFFSARRGEYRIVYRLDDAAHTIRVDRIGHRSKVYRRR